MRTGLNSKAAPVGDVNKRTAGNLLYVAFLLNSDYHVRSNGRLIPAVPRATREG